MTQRKNFIVTLLSFLFIFGALSEIGAQRRRAPVTVKDVTNPTETTTKRNPTDQIGDNSRVQVEPSVEPSSIRLHVHYPKDYGYREISSWNKSPFSCDAFRVDAVRFRSGNEGRGDLLMTIANHTLMRSEGGQYICDFTVSSVPLNETINVRVSMAGDAVLSESWLSGSNPQPPPGSERTILYGNQDVTLTTGEPSRLLEFEMAYRSRLRRRS